MYRNRFSLLSEMCYYEDEEGVESKEKVEEDEVDSGFAGASDEAIGGWQVVGDKKLPVARVVAAKPPELPKNSLVFFINGDYGGFNWPDEFVLQALRLVAVAPGEKGVETHIEDRYWKTITFNGKYISTRSFLRFTDDIRLVCLYWLMKKKDHSRSDILPAVFRFKTLPSMEDLLGSFPYTGNDYVEPIFPPMLKYSEYDGSENLILNEERYLIDHLLADGCSTNLEQRIKDILLEVREQNRAAYSFKTPEAFGFVDSVEWLEKRWEQYVEDVRSGQSPPLHFSSLLQKW